MKGLLHNWLINPSMAPLGKFYPTAQERAYLPTVMLQVPQQRHLEVISSILF